ncbi:uncharacterized protein LOC114532537 [Dendronephthya gigantea]|uniref:uncharacterized protein LOC114532537 n=1 Tax=Dendronephthya gigantea TaxID=151771 RepID=UPI00106A2F14|nr:uncharacterized protein LOC114532537 [Dendronephthya gigantea]
MAGILAEVDQPNYPWSWSEADQKADKLEVGTRVWAEWDKNEFYRGTVKIIRGDDVTVLFDDGYSRMYKASSEEFSESIVIDSEIRKNQTPEIKEGDYLLVPINDSKGEVMQKGVVTIVGKVFFTLNLLPDLAKKRVRKRSTALRLFNKKAGETAEVKFKKELDDSVEILKVVKGLESLDPYGQIENDDLPDALSPEVLWDHGDLIDFTSPGENINCSSSFVFTPPYDMTIGLSMDPLARKTIPQTSTPVMFNISSNGD